MLGGMWDWRRIDSGSGSIFQALGAVFVAAVIALVVAAHCHSAGDELDNPSKVQLPQSSCKVVAAKMVIDTATQHQLRIVAMDGSWTVLNQSQFDGAAIGAEICTTKWQPVQ